MNIEHLRRALKSEWLNYYRQNRHWIVRLGVWVNYQGQRRPSASFILGALSTLDPQLIQLLPLVVDLNSSPDRIVMALGLNFNPEEELEALAEAELPPIQEQKITKELSPAPEKKAVKESRSTPERKIAKMLPSSDTPVNLTHQPNHRRMPLDTAQLSAHELPDRSITSASRSDRRREKAQWD